MDTRHDSATITLTDSALTAMLTDAVALTDLLTRITNTNNPAAMQRITRLLDQLNTTHQALTHNP